MVRISCILLSFQVMSLSTCVENGCVAGGAGSGNCEPAHYEKQRTGVAMLQTASPLMNEPLSALYPSQSSASEKSFLDVDAAVLRDYELKLNAISVVNKIKVPSKGQRGDTSSVELAGRDVLERVVPSALDAAISKAQGGNNRESVESMEAGGPSAACFGSMTPKMIILSLVANLSPEYVLALRANRAMVTTPYNYMYCEYNHSLDTHRYIAWSKIIAVRHLLDTRSEPIVWMDADAIFTASKRFEDITTVPFLQGKDIVFTDNPGSVPVNTGVFVSKCTAWTRKFWKAVYYEFPESISSPLWDNHAVMMYGFVAHPQDFAIHAAVVSRHLMNDVGKYDASFIAHPAGGHKKIEKWTALLQKMRRVNAEYTR